MNIQDAVDFRMHQLDDQEQARLASKCGIAKYYHCPVWDSDTDQYASMVWQACLQLNKCVNEQHEHVFVHCSAGVSRSSTVYLAFISLFGLQNMVVDEQDSTRSTFSPEAVFIKDQTALVDQHDHYLRNYHHLSFANKAVVHKVITKNKGYVEEMRRLRYQDSQADLAR